jgi:transcriptional regulator
MMLSAMVGFELKVTAFECKLKVNQHRPEAHEATVKMYAGGSEDQRILADWMLRLKAEKASGDGSSA